MQISKKWIALGVAIGLVAGINGATAQNYPNRAITLVIPFARGGSTSIVGRGIADKMSELLGEKVVVDNRPGAGGTVGTRAVAKSEPDGYTLVLGYTGTLAIGPSLYKNVGYDPRKDFAPIGLIGNAPNSLVVHPSFPAKTVAELIAYAKANPGKVNFGSAGAGTASHITGEYFAASAGIKLVHIPYKGAGPALTDLLGGHIPMAFAPIPASHSSAGLLRALAVTSATRSALLPPILPRPRGLLDAPHSRGMTTELWIVSGLTCAEHLLQRSDALSSDSSWFPVSRSRAARHRAACCRDGCCSAIAGNRRRD